MRRGETEACCAVQIGLVKSFRGSGPLDPLVTSLMDFSTLEELSLKIFQLWQVAQELSSVLWARGLTRVGAEDGPGRVRVSQPRGAQLRAQGKAE